MYVKTECYKKRNTTKYSVSCERIYNISHIVPVRTYSSQT